MIKIDEDALICDLAETYNIYDYRQLPIDMVAVFSYGLKDDSRIKMKMGGQLVPLETLVLAGISDKVNTLVWFQTEDGQKGKNRPNPLTNALTGNESKSESGKDSVVFESGEDFAKVRQKLIQNGGE